MAARRPPSAPRLAGRVRNNWLAGLGAGLRLRGETVPPSSASRISLLVLNLGTRFAATGTRCPVCGLRPTRDRRSFTEKAPKPLISTRLPLASAPFPSIRG
jgi:hypothetical protein